MKLARKPQLGSVSQGTLLNADLLDAFADELESLAAGDDKAALDLIAEARNAIKGDCETEDGSTLLGVLTEQIESHATPYLYFGTHAGDGAEFGWWPDMDSINELPRIGDPGEHDGEECCFVNDHGNVTVYAADGSIILDLV